MTRCIVALAFFSVLTCCAEAPVPREPSQPAEPPQPGPTPPASAPASPPPPTEGRARTDAGVPPLASPNALAAGKADAGPDTEAPTGDPRTAGIRRIGVAAQDCHARHAPGIKGHLTLRIVRDQTGAVTRVSVVRAQSSAELARPAFETCVLDAAKKERLSPARDEDDEIELPLTFEPNP